MTPLIGSRGKSQITQKTMKKHSNPQENNKQNEKNILEQLFFNVINENKKNIIAELQLL